MDLFKFIILRIFNIKFYHIFIKLIYNLILIFNNIINNDEKNKVLAWKNYERINIQIFLVYKITSFDDDFNNDDWKNRLELKNNNNSYKNDNSDILFFIFDKNK